MLEKWTVSSLGSNLRVLISRKGHASASLIVKKPARDGSGDKFSAAMEDMSRCKLLTHLHTCGLEPRKASRASSLTLASEPTRLNTSLMCTVHLKFLKRYGNATCRHERHTSAQGRRRVSSRASSTSSTSAVESGEIIRLKTMSTISGGRVCSPMFMAMIHLVMQVDMSRQTTERVVFVALRYGEGIALLKYLSSGEVGHFQQVLLFVFRTLPEAM